jgi:hypothetical protein
MMTTQQRAKLAWLAAKQLTMELDGLWERSDKEIEQVLGPEVAHGEFDEQLQDVEGVLEAILTVGWERKELLDRLRAALNRKDQEHALILARQLCNAAERKVS